MRREAVSVNKLSKFIRSQHFGSTVFIQCLSQGSCSPAKAPTRKTPADTHKGNCLSTASNFPVNKGAITPALFVKTHSISSHSHSGLERKKH